MDHTSEKQRLMPLLTDEGSSMCQRSTWSHTLQKSLIFTFHRMEPHFAFRYPPYSEGSYNTVLARVTGLKIPDA